MTQYGYTEFFQQYPDIYRGFHEVVGHAPNFYQQLQKLNLLNARTVLSIGSGEGELEHNIAKKHNTKIGVIEPNPHFMKKYSQQMKESHLENFCLESFLGTFQDYKPHNPYDLVISVHSWYAMGLNTDLLKKALKCLRPGGKLFITIISHKNPVWKIAYLVDNDSAGHISGESLSEWANAQGISHQYIENKNRIPRSKVFSEGDNFTRLGELFACFPTFNTWNNLEQVTRDEIIKIINGSMDGSDLVLTNGCLLFQA
jgi:SAM-dependent methyltransferase